MRGGLTQVGLSATDHDLGRAAAFTAGLRGLVIVVPLPAKALAGLLRQITLLGRQGQRRVAGQPVQKAAQALRLIRQPQEAPLGLAHPAIGRTAGRATGAGRFVLLQTLAGIKAEQNRQTDKIGAYLNHGINRLCIPQKYNFFY